MLLPKETMQDKLSFEIYVFVIKLFIFKKNCHIAKKGHSWLNIYMYIFF